MRTPASRAASPAVNWKKSGILTMLVSSRGGKRDAENLHIKWDDDACSSRGGQREEEDHSAALQKLDGEDTLLFRGENGEHLLESQSDEEHAGDHEAGDDLSAIPWVQDAAERDGHDS